jgi:hypothetical protein
MLQGIRVFCTVGVLLLIGYACLANDASAPAAGTYRQLSDTEAARIVGGAATGGGTAGPQKCETDTACNNPYEPCAGVAACRRAGGNCNPPRDSFARTWYTHEICQMNGTKASCDRVVSVNTLCRQIYECNCKLDTNKVLICSRDSVGPNCLGASLDPGRCMYTPCPP